MNSTLKLLILTVLSILSVSAFAQPNEGQQDANPGENAQYEASFHLGNLLPNQIPGVTEIMGLGGVRAGYRISKGAYAETGLLMGNGAGASWKNYHIDIRMDNPIEGVIAMAYVGADSVYYEGRGGSGKLIFGGHAGGGIRLHVSGVCWFRTDMKFGFSPGTSLYIGAGFEFRFGEGGQGGGAS